MTDEFVYPLVDTIMFYPDGEVVVSLIDPSVMNRSYFVDVNRMPYESLKALEWLFTAMQHYGAALGVSGPLKFVLHAGSVFDYDFTGETVISIIDDYVPVATRMAIWSTLQAIAMLCRDYPDLEPGTPKTARVF